MRLYLVSYVQFMQNLLDLKTYLFSYLQGHLKLLKQLVLGLGLWSFLNHRLLAHDWLVRIVEHVKLLVVNLLLLFEYHHLI